jgi:protein O-mannosyl-transferase
MGSKKKERRKEKAEQTGNSKVTQSKVNAAQAVKGFPNQFIIPAIIFIGIAFILYGSSLKFGYVLDDEMVITKNDYVQKGLAGIADIFRYDTFLGYLKDVKNLYLVEGGRYRPLSLVTFAMEVAFFGPDKPGISHFINILLYALTAVMLFRILRKIFPDQVDKNWWVGFPFLAALIWLLHPIHTEGIANIKGRDEILALMGSLAALWAAIKYVDSGKKSWVLLSAFFLFLGLLSKENALTFIVVIPLTIWFFRKPDYSMLKTIVIPLLVSSILFLIIRYQALGFFFSHGRGVSDLMNDPFIGMQKNEKFATIFLTLGWYIKLLFFPIQLTHDYYPYHVPLVGWTDYRAFLSLLAFAGLGIWAVLQIKNKNVFAYCILFFLVTLSIVSNLFFSIGSFMNERFVYMPSVAFAIFIGYLLLVKLPSMNINFKWPSVAVLIVMGSLFAYKTYSRVPDWKDALTLNTSAIKISTNSTRANCFYASSLYEMKYQKSTDPKEQAILVDTMEKYVNRALEIYPTYSSALQIKAGVVGARYQLNKNVDSLINGLRSIVKITPKNKYVREFAISYIRYIFNQNREKSYGLCEELGTFIFNSDKKDTASYLPYLKQCLELQPFNYAIMNKLLEAYTLAGDLQNAAIIRRRLAGM